MEKVQGCLFLVVYAALTFMALRALFSGKHKAALLLIFCLAALLRIFVAGDLYLHEWDERFHAVIAKNIWASPFAPQLYTDGILDYNFFNWSESDLWLSKPFLPFWILGSSISLFGNNEFGLRLPSILIGLSSLWLTYRIGKEYYDIKAASIATFLHAIHGITLEFGAGRTSSDHLDVFFVFLFQLTVYSYLISAQKQQKRWFFVVGVLAGAAFLTKWIMACFVLMIIALLHSLQPKAVEVYIKDTASILTGFCLMVTPWVVYLTRYFPEEIGLIFQQLLGRSQASFEGHTGGIFFYVEDTGILFGFGIFLALGWLVIRLFKAPHHREKLLASWILAPLLILSLLATKRNTYLVMLAPAFFLLTGHFITWLLQYSTKPQWLKISVITLLLGLPVQYSLERIKPFALRFMQPVWRVEMENNIRQLRQSTRQPIVMDNEPHAFAAMYYYDVLAYTRKLRPQEKQQLREAGYLYVVADAGSGPKHLRGAKD